MRAKIKVHAKTSDAQKLNSSFVTNGASSRLLNSPIEQLLYLQRTIGNQTVQALFRHQNGGTEINEGRSSDVSIPPNPGLEFSKISIYPPRSRTIQANLKINQPGDKYEQEADRVAEQVMRMPGIEIGSVSLNEEGIQRKCTACESGGTTCPECAEEEEKIQAKPLASQIAPLAQRHEVPGHTPVATPQSASQINSLRSGGRPLAEATRQFFEPRLGRNFSGVRVHVGPKAIGSARAIGARAYTIGQDIIFGAGAYAPETIEGQKLLAHELTHVVQQRASTDIRRKKENRSVLRITDFPWTGRINTEGTGFHHQPRQAKGNKDYIRPDFKLGDSITVLGKTSMNWLQVRRIINGKTQEGYIDWRYVNFVPQQQKQPPAKPKKSIGEQVMEEIKQNRDFWCKDADKSLKTTDNLIWCGYWKSRKEGYLEWEYDKRFKKFNKADYPRDTFTGKKVCATVDPRGNCVQYTKEQWERNINLSHRKQFPKNCIRVDWKGECVASEAEARRVWNQLDPDTQNLLRGMHLLGISSAMPLKEAKRLMSMWDKGSFPTRAKSIRHHANKHGFGDDVAKYMRKAANFNKKGARKKELEDGAIRWNRKSGEFLIERGGKIVSYGVN